ncbi:MAG: YlxR family protein [Tissierellia bacterium]|nr:YlxR family protein [Tissierellia bacterium]
MAKKRKIPIRKCIGCGEGKPKKELIRIVRTPEGEVKADLTGRANGRGAYICPAVECLNKAIKTKSIARSLETDIPDEVYEEIREVIGNLEEENTLK